MYAEDQDENVTKYIYGVGLIGQIVDDELSVYHYDYRGSAVAITNSENGTITDTFKYDTYGKLIGRTGTSNISFKYNGRDGVITDENGLLYMRARYYNPDLQRFVNADIIVGEVSDYVTINRYAYANGNPVSNVDPFGLSVDRNKTASKENFWQLFKNDDGSYSLYDNRRHQSNNIFHEQILSAILDKWSVDLLKGDLTFGELNLTGITGGWEYEYIDLSLLDMGSIKLSGGMKDYGFDLSALASAYSPDITLKLGEIKITLSAEIGAIGGSVIVDPTIGKYSIKGAYGLGFGLSFSMK